MDIRVRAATGISAERNKTRSPIFAGHPNPAILSIGKWKDLRMFIAG
jgi:hypothetical protein